MAVSVEATFDQSKLTSNLLVLCLLASGSQVGRPIGAEDEYIEDFQNTPADAHYGRLDEGVTPTS